MRKSIVALLVAFTMTLGLPTVGSAQTGKAGNLFGQIVDATGRGSSGRTVELVNDGMVVGMTTSSYDGHFTFAVGGSGTYVVRTIVNGHPAGVRVSVVRGQNPPMALLVLPSIATSSAQAGVLISSGLSSLASLASVTLSTAAAAFVTNIAEKNDAEILADPDTTLKTVAILNQIIQQISPGAPPITISAGGTIVVPPGLGAVINNPGIVTAINNVVINVPTGSGH